MGAEGWAGCGRSPRHGGWPGAGAAPHVAACRSQAANSTLFCASFISGTRSDSQAGIWVCSTPTVNANAFFFFSFSLSVFTRVRAGREVPGLPSGRGAGHAGVPAVHRGRGRAQPHPSESSRPFSRPRNLSLETFVVRLRRGVFPPRAPCSHGGWPGHAPHYRSATPCAVNRDLGLRHRAYRSRQPLCRFIRPSSAAPTGRGRWGRAKKGSKHGGWKPRRGEVSEVSLQGLGWAERLSRSSRVHAGSGGEQEGGGVPAKGCTTRAGAEDAQDFSAACLSPGRAVPPARAPGQRVPKRAVTDPPGHLPHASAPHELPARGTGPSAWPLRPGEPGPWCRAGDGDREEQEQGGSPGSCHRS